MPVHSSDASGGRADARKPESALSREEPPPDRGSDQGDYRPQLDGVRACSVAVVLCSHFMPSTWTTAKTLLPAGLSGVDVFFVLSGFLITGILLKGKKAIERGTATWGSVVRAFYLRRTLRIFPIYYLTLVFAVVAGLGITIHQLPWHAGYLSNVLMFRLDRYMGPTTHLWSLAVEEQFYALWPALVLAVPRNRLRSVLWILVLGGMGVRLWGQLSGRYFMQMQLPACVDLFAIGAFLADAQDRSVVALRRMGDLALRGGMALILVASLVEWAKPELQFWGLMRRSAVGLVAAWLVSRAAVGFRAGAGAFLEAGPMRYLGKVSYGIYLFHAFIAEALIVSSIRYGFPLPSENARFFVLCGLSVLAASASWRFIEEPLLRLKGHRLCRATVVTEGRA